MFADTISISSDMTINVISFMSPPYGPHDLGLCAGGVSRTVLWRPVELQTL